jgi:hypothetical protein
MERFCAFILTIVTGFITQQPTMATSRFSSSSQMMYSQK